MFSKMLVLLMSFTLGAYAAAWAVPHNLAGTSAPYTGIFVIVAGALLGLFVGGLTVLSWD